VSKEHLVNKVRRECEVILDHQESLELQEGLEEEVNLDVMDPQDLLDQTVIVELKVFQEALVPPAPQDQKDNRVIVECLAKQEKRDLREVLVDPEKLGVKENVDQLDPLENLEDQDKEASGEHLEKMGDPVPLDKPVLVVRQALLVCKDQKDRVDLPVVTVNPVYLATRVFKEMMAPRDHKA